MATPNPVPVYTNPGVLQNAVGGAPAVDPLTTAMNQIAAQQNAANAQMVQANNQALQAQYAQQAADYGLQGQQAVSTAQGQIDQLFPRIGEIQSARDLANAQAQQSAIFSNAKDQNTLAGRGLGTSGIALGQFGRDQAALGQKIAGTDLSSTQQQDAISRQITALQQQAQQNVSAYNQRIGALSQAGAKLPTTAAAVGAGGAA